uniref:tRNA pseudouridine synthase B n=1 Tax=Arthrobacter castelli TaxID=271431 RepID=UPI00047C1A65
GVLVIGINKATRLLTYIVGVDKTYRATIRLGQSTITDDAEGEVTGGADTSGVDEAAVRAAIGDLTGDLQQVPSSVSAIKVDGKRSYAQVRSGEEVKLAPRPVTVSRFEVHDIRRVDAGSSRDGGAGGAGQLIDVDATVECSSGTYIRALARDAGESLHTGGHLTALRRTRVGPYTLDQAATLEQLAEELQVLDLSEAAGAMFDGRELSADEAADLSFGRRIAPGSGDGVSAAFAPDGTLMALLQNKDDAAKPVLVFAPASEQRG